MEKEVRRLEREIWKLADCEFNVNSPSQLAEILFDKLNLAGACAARKGQSALDGGRHPRVHVRISTNFQKKSSSTGKLRSSSQPMWMLCQS